MLTKADKYKYSHSTQKQYVRDTNPDQTDPETNPKSRTETKRRLSPQDSALLQSLVARCGPEHETTSHTEPQDVRRTICQGIRSAQSAALRRFPETRLGL